MVEAAASGDPYVGPTDVDVTGATEATKVTAGEVSTAKMASSKMASTSVASASASGLDHRRYCCGTSQKDGSQDHRHRLSKHRSLVHSFLTH
jgi:hypothetical protein